MVTEVGTIMRLRDIVKNLSWADQELTIYAAEPWSPDSEAMLAREPDEGGVPGEASGAQMTYFLEVFHLAARRTISASAW